MKNKLKRLISVFLVVVLAINATYVATFASLKMEETTDSIQKHDAESGFQKDTQADYTFVEEVEIDIHSAEAETSNVIFTFSENLLHDNTLFIKRGDKNFDLLYGVVATDETGRELKVLVADDGKIDIYAIYPHNSFTIIYSAIHPVTYEKYLQARKIVVIESAAETPVLFEGRTVHTVATTIELENAIQSGLDEDNNRLVIVSGEISIFTSLSIPYGRTITLIGDPTNPGTISQRTANQRHFFVDGTLIIGDDSNPIEDMGTNDITIWNSFTGNGAGGIVVNPSGAMYMHGGKILRNTADSSSVNLGQGTFHMYGGIINSGGTNFHSTGVVFTSGIFHMYGGTITGNMGGGVAFTDGSFYMYDGASVINNTAFVITGSRTGGVQFTSGTFTMHGGLIGYNRGRASSSSNAGGVSFGNGTFIMYDGIITGNTRPSINSAGAGGVWSEAGRFYMHKGTISNNSSNAGTTNFQTQNNTAGGVYIGNISRINIGNVNGIDTSEYIYFYGNSVSNYRSISSHPMLGRQALPNIRWNGWIDDDNPSTSLDEVVHLFNRWDVHVSNMRSVEVLNYGENATVGSPPLPLSAGHHHGEIIYLPAGTRVAVYSGTRASQNFALWEPSNNTILPASGIEQPSVTLTLPTSTASAQRHSQITANWEDIIDIVHNITFDFNFEEAPSPLTLTVFHGATLDMEDIPDTSIRIGYDFVAWHNENGEVWNISTPVTEDTVLVAQWSPIMRNISIQYMVDGEEYYPGTDDNFVYQVGKIFSCGGYVADINKMLGTETKEYTFTGWTTACLEIVNFDATSLNSSFEVPLLSSSSETIILVANWKSGSIEKEITPEPPAPPKEEDEDEEDGNEKEIPPTPPAPPIESGENNYSDNEKEITPDLQTADAKDNTYNKSEGEGNERRDYEFHPVYVIGDDKGNFRPHSNLTRAEAVTILVRTHLLNFEHGIRRLPLGMVNFTSFSDVNPDQWYYYYIAWAYDAGLIQGYVGKFRPDEFITKEEVATLLARTLTVRPAGLRYMPFYDAKNISEWVNAYVYTAYQDNLVAGGGNNFSANDNITRAEAITAMNNILNRIGNREVWNVTRIENFYNAHLFPDVETTSWYFPSVVTASNNHRLTRDDDGNINWIEFQAQ